MDTQQQVRQLLGQIRAVSNSPIIDRASNQLEILCRAYMELDQPSNGRALGFSRSLAAMFDLLLARRGKTVTRSALLDVCFHNADKEPDIKIVDIYICRMRKKLPAQYKIETIWGVGYQLAA